MVVGSAVARLRLFGIGSLKDKRRIVRSLLERLRNRFGAAVAEVGEQDNPHLAVLGLACVSSNRHLVRKILGEMEDWLCGNGEGELLHYRARVDWGG